MNDLYMDYLVYKRITKDIRRGWRDSSSKPPKIMDFDEWKLSEDEDEFTFMIISAIKRDGTEINYTVYDEKTEGWSSMARTTGLTACAFAKLIAEKNITKTGIICPEVLGQDKNNYDFVTNFLKNKNIRITCN